MPSQGYFKEIRRTKATIVLTVLLSLVNDAYSAYDTY